MMEKTVTLQVKTALIKWCSIFRESGDKIDKTKTINNDKTTRSVNDEF